MGKRLKIQEKTDKVICERPLMAVSEEAKNNDRNKYLFLLNNDFKFVVDFNFPKVLGCSFRWKNSVNIKSSTF